MKLQRRLSFHFIYQMIIYSALMLIITIVLLFTILNRMTLEEMKYNFAAGALDTIVSATYVSGNKAEVPKSVEELIEKRNAWLQIINQEGEVIHSINPTSLSLPEAYSTAQLLTIQNTNKYRHYAVDTKLDLTYSKPVLFMVGYESPRFEQLASWYEAYMENGIVGEAYQEGLRLKLQETDSFLTVLNAAGESIQTIGVKPPASHKYEPLEIIGMHQSPGHYDNSIIVYQHDEASTTWIVHTPNEPGNIVKRPLFEDEVRIFIVVGLFILIFALLISIWHGYRYSRPLLLFAGWFERMENGRYDEVLTDRDKRKVFRKSGKLRMRYKLLKEVIQSFYRMAEKLAQTEKERSRLEQLREEWMSGISHDLRTPLSTIQGYGYILESNSSEWSQEELREMGRMIREKGDYMLELITDFSLISKLKQQGMPVDRRELELSELLRQSVLKYVNDATLTDVDFRFECGEDERSIPIMGNPNWLRRLIDNLLSNAVKHNAPGVTVTVSCGMMNDEPYFSVADNGRGMDEETQSKLFERYYRGTSTEETTAGSGLGMSIARMIVEAHNGRIQVMSELGSGTTITVQFSAQQK